VIWVPVKLALIVVLPDGAPETGVARPAGVVALVLVTCASEQFVGVQFTMLVTSCVVESARVATAINCCDCPAASENVEGEIAIEVAGALLTVTAMEADISPDVTVKTADPGALAVTVKPSVEVETMFGLLEAQAIGELGAPLEPSAKTPFANSLN